MAIEPTAPDPSPEPTEVPQEEDLSLAEHEAQFGEGAKRPEPDAEPEPEEDIRRPPRERPRDDSGKFTKPERHRAKSQEASPEDRPRIQELTKRLREAETERDVLRARQTAIPVQPTPRLAEPPIVSPAPSSHLPEASQTPAKPVIDNFEDYSAYVEALADWKIGEARRVDHETATRDAEIARVTASWRDRVADAKTRHEDFEQVALLAPTDIPQGSLVDAWILEHRSGADVLYTLQKDPAELRRILALPLFDQVDALSLLAQRLSPPREPAVRSGAAATTPRSVAPRPPTPLRTSASSAPDEPPGDDASLADHEKYWHKRRE